LVPHPEEARRKGNTAFTGKEKLVVNRKIYKL
jgi:hypothetical protein